MPDTLTKLAYQTLQQGKSYFALAHKAASTQLTSLVISTNKQPKTDPLPPQVLLQIQQSLESLVETDWRDVEAGVYPTDVLFENRLEDLLTKYPQIWLDLPSIWQRIETKQAQVFASDIDVQGYPSYYLQNFHYQTNGYLSDRSADLYDLQVEILFNGTADAMRRRVLLPLKQGLAPISGTDKPRILDVACGTGRTLKFVRAALPNASLFGVDLSPAYLRKANQILSEMPGTLPQLLQANAEELPYRDDYFHGITCVFLFHELPGNARQQVINECFRVVQPGGVLVICDSIQVSDRPEFEPAMHNFYRMFHEPYYRHYMTDDIVARLAQAGFTEVATQVHFMSKYWVARKPA